MLNEQVRSLPSASAGPAMGLALRILKRIEYGSLRVAHGDCEWRLLGSKPGPESTLKLNNPARLLSKVLLRGDIGFAESYMHRDWDSPNLAALLLFLAQNEQALSARSRSFVLVSWLNRLRHRINRNSVRGSRRNIAAHYDLGNDFYRLWLDPSMTYSSALFEHGERDLERGATAKIRSPA